VRTKFTLLCALSLLGTILAIGALGQTLTTGDIVGTVLDLSGALIPNARVSLRSNEKGFSQASVSDARGFYRFAFLAPSSYVETVSAPGFATVTRTVLVVVGETTSLDLILQVESAHTTIEVTSESPLTQNQSADISTTFNAKQIANLPNPGNDLTYTVQTAPGAVMNTQGGTGNFSTFGLPATSNSFNLDGMNDNDPSLLVNNSGASNLLLGNNEVEEVTIVNDGYSGQYGGFAGASVNYVTKSGSNDLHGNAQYWWNGRVLNANNWFNKDVPSGTPVVPRPFVNANQYAASLGGPIRKNKIFFFVDYEGLRFVLPVDNLVLIPSREFEAATLDNLESTGHQASVPFYNQMFDLWNQAPGADRALPGDPQTGNSTGCNGFTGRGGLGTTVPCALSFRSTADNLTREYLLGARFDLNVGKSDKLFLRLHEDQGVQATYTDPISPVFNLQSNAPVYQGQISETHIFNPRAVNVVVISAFYGSFIFQQKDPFAARAAFATTLLLGDGSFTALGASTPFSPIGSKPTHYQVLDDLSLVRRNHSLKFGFDFNRFDLSAYNSHYNQAGSLTPFTLADFFAGGDGPSGDLLQQNFPAIGTKPLALYWLGFYGQDDWRANRTLTLTFSLRADHSSNPVCQIDCFARFVSDFDSMNHDVNIPYNQAIRIGLHRALPSITNLEWQPRLGFAWAPLGLKSMVLSGGLGLFMDVFPSAIISGNVSSNPPLLNSFTTYNNNLSPAEPSNLFRDAASSNAAFVSGFLSGGTLASISAEASFFVPPNFTNTVPTKVPRYQEWNLKMLEGFGANTSLTLNYVGNHGIQIPVFFGAINAFCPLVNSLGPSCPSGFAGLPDSAPDSRFGAVNELRSAGVSNYNGLAISFQLRLKQVLQLHSNYVWSHALDEVSNGGIWSFNPMSTLLNPQGNNLPSSYGNADYDTRHYFSTDVICEVPHQFGPEVLLKGWQLSATAFRRSGFPYTVLDSFSTSVLGQFNYAEAVYANFLGGSARSCGNPKHACLQESQFSSPIAQVPAEFGTEHRNQFYGPGFFNADLSIIKNTPIPGREKAELGVGAQFYNLFNHPNFNQPNADIANPGQFGFITGTVNPPTTIYGSLLGGDASPRSIQLTARLTF
jgi:hypothetical protein